MSPGCFPSRRLLRQTATTRTCARSAAAVASGLAVRVIDVPHTNFLLRDVAGYHPKPRGTRQTIIRGERSQLGGLLLPEVVGGEEPIVLHLCGQPTDLEVVNQSEQSRESTDLGAMKRKNRRTRWSPAIIDREMMANGWLNLSRRNHHALSTLNPFFLPRCPANQPVGREMKRGAKIPLLSSQLSSFPPRAAQ